MADTFTGSGDTVMGFTKKFVVPGGNGAAGIHLPVAKSMDVAAALAADTAFPDRELDLAEFTLSAESGKPIRFGDGAGKVSFSGSANSVAGLGVFVDPNRVSGVLPFDDALEGAMHLELASGEMFVVLRWGYELAGAAKGSLALGAGLKATFGVDGKTDGGFAVIRRLPKTTGARSAIAQTVRSWALPRQVHGPADIEPGSWIVAEVDGAIAAHLGAEFGYNFNWAREAALGGLKQDIGLRLQLRVAATLGFEASGKYAVMVSRESAAAGDQRLRLRLFKQSKRGMNFAFNAAASAQLQTPGAPQSVDELVMAVFDIHPSQLIDDLHAIEKWMGSGQTLPDALAGLTNTYVLKLLHDVTGVDPATAFDAARRKLLDLLAEWDRLPQKVSGTVLKLLEERVDLTTLRAMAQAIAQDAPGAFRHAIEQQLQDVNFFRTPAGRWLEAAAEDGILAVINDAAAFKALQSMAAATARLLDGSLLGATLSRLQTALMTRLNLGPIVDGIKEEDFTAVDEWLKLKLSQFLGRHIDFAGLQDVRATVAVLLAKRDEFYTQALAALTDKYSFTFAAKYQRTSARTALLDAEFDFAQDAAAAAALLAEALDGNFRTLLTEPSPAVHLHPAMLSHEIRRTSHVELHLPRISRTTDALTTSLANVTAQDDGDGRLLAYDLKASDRVTQKGLRDSRVAVAARLPVRKGVGVRVHSTDGLSYTYAFRQAVRSMKSADVQAQLQPYLEAYFAPLFTGEARPSTWIADMDKQIDALEFNGTENFGNVLVSLELGLPASVAGAWLEAPAEETAPSYMEMSRRIQRKLKALIPFYYLADVANLRRHEFVAPLLVYASIPESTDIDFDGHTATINPAHPRGLYLGLRRSPEAQRHDPAPRRRRTAGRADGEVPGQAGGRLDIRRAVLRAGAGRRHPVRCRQRTRGDDPAGTPLERGADHRRRAARRSQPCEIPRGGLARSGTRRGGALTIRRPGHAGVQRAGPQRLRRRGAQAARDHAVRGGGAGVPVRRGGHGSAVRALRTHRRAAGLVVRPGHVPHRPSSAGGGRRGGGTARDAGLRLADRGSDQPFDRARVQGIPARSMGHRFRRRRPGRRDPRPSPASQPHADDPG